ncbi:hypothetical protein NC653_037178 [Populus alba x Populus x berolinensis]|uniref:Uncharacterized protein n=1 Tax=Populus alba x Populus x berolinensis TaxID=444605 RepID=A0AAD6LGF6_9ROSI|nr:hypothetical protein NC653_037178 [Populus alba x Populus x berolinensis]
MSARTSIFLSLTSLNGRDSSVQFPHFCSLHGFAEGPDMDPLGRRPLLPLNNRAARVQASRVRSRVRMETEEQQGIALVGLHCK